MSAVAINDHTHVVVPGLQLAVRSSSDIKTDNAKVINASPSAIDDSESKTVNIIESNNIQVKETQSIIKMLLLLLLLTMQTITTAQNINPGSLFHALMNSNNA